MSLFFPSPNDVGILQVENSEATNDQYGDKKNKKTEIILLVIAAIFILINLTRCFNGDFWQDECRSILISQQSFWDIIENSVSDDMHPPLFYLAMSLFEKIFGDTAFAYHFTVLVAYASIMLISATVVYHQFGPKASIALMLLTSLLSAAYEFNTEVRMYEMAMLFTLVVFLSFYFILRYNRTIDWCILVASSILAGYTYYYCLLVIGFVFLSLLILYFKDEEKRKKLICSYLVTGVSILLLAVPLFNTISEGTNGFWITDTETLEDAILYLFDSKISIILIMIFVIMFTMFFMTTKRDRTEKNIYQRIVSSNNDSKLIVVGLVAVFGSYLIVRIISELFTPLSLQRHLYFMSVIVWLLFAVLLSKIDFGKLRKPMLAIFAVCIVVGCSSFYGYIDEENKNWESTQNVLSHTEDIKEGDTIFSNEWHFAKETLSVIKYYYKNTETVYTSMEKIIVNKDTGNWIFSDDGPLNSNAIKNLNKQGYDAKFIIDGIFAKEYYVHVYRIVPMNSDQR